MIMIVLMITEQTVAAGKIKIMIRIRSKKGNPGYLNVSHTVAAPAPAGKSGRGGSW